MKITNILTEIYFQQSMPCCELTDLVAAAAEGLLLCLLIKVHSTYFGLFAFGLFRLVSAYSLSQTTIESIEINRLSFPAEQELGTS